MGSPVNRSRDGPWQVQPNGRLSSTDSFAGCSAPSPDQESVMNPEGVDYRAESSFHMRQRKECLKKAELAHSRRQHGVSTYYSKQAQEHFKKAEEANLAAAAQTFNSSNANKSKKEVDLHGLHVAKAVEVVKEVINTLRREGKEESVNIITGCGNRSKNGISRVRQAVEDYLHRNRIRYKMENPGMIRVTL